MRVMELLLEPILYIVIILPLLLIFMKERTKKNYLRVASIVVCYFIYYFALTVQYQFDCLNIIGGNWNWDGKIYGTVCGLVMYFIFRRQFSDNDFFTLKQNKDGLKSALTVAGVLVAFFILSGVVAEKEFNLETLFFQISMPGIDEEIMYRGVLLGLMCSALRSGGAAWRNPAIIINGILFGLAHSLMYQDGKLVFNVGPFISIGMVGYAFGYIAFKTRSILIPMLTHNICNFSKTLLSMIL